jgi:hypothetical protein
VSKLHKHSVRNEHYFANLIDVWRLGHQKSSEISRLTALYEEGRLRKASGTRLAVFVGAGDPNGVQVHASRLHTAALFGFASAKLAATLTKREAFPLRGRRASGGSG